MHPIRHEIQFPRQPPGEPELQSVLAPIGVQRTLWAWGRSAGSIDPNTVSYALARAVEAASKAKISRAWLFLCSV